MTCPQQDAKNAAPLAKHTGASVDPQLSLVAGLLAIKSKHSHHPEQGGNLFLRNVRNPVSTGCVNAQTQLCPQ